jgi:hypothetical protein
MKLIRYRAYRLWAKVRWQWRKRILDRFWTHAPLWKWLWDDEEDIAYESQIRWIKKHIGQEEADGANLGWWADGSYIGTKIYGENGGVLTTNIDTLEHQFEPW